jgi:hypothetical protein
MFGHDIRDFGFKAHARSLEHAEHTLQIVQGMRLKYYANAEHRSKS